MRKIHIAGFALVAALVFSAMASASAFAAPEWLVNGAALSGSLAVKSHGKVVLTDLNAKVKLECEGTDSGTVTGPNLSEETTVTATSCKTLEGTCPSPSAKAHALPWKLELEEKVAGKVTNNFLTESGYEVVCAGIVHDTCVAKAGVPVLRLTNASLVEFEFPVTENENTAECSLSLKLVGDVAGTVVVESNVSGKTLTES
jgi:hypothetical protein